MARRMTSPVLVGRSDVVGQLEAAFTATRTGTPRHVVIGGEAGVGKTRLLSEMRSIAEAGGARVLLGGCVSMGDEGLPFAPFTEIIRSLVAQEGVSEVRTVAGRAVADLARLVPVLGRGEPAPGHEVWAQTRLYEALLDLFRRLSERGPTVVQLEDLHWADAGTLAATSYLLRAVHDEPITVVVTYRSDDITRRHPLRAWLAEVARDPDVERLDLEPLAELEVTSLVRQITDEDLPAAELDDIARRSDGNPFFIEELLASRGDGRNAIPGELRDILLSRVDDLPASAQRLLDLAAVGGRVVEHHILRSLLDGDNGSMAADLRSLVEAGLLTPTQAPDGDDAYAFRHALVQEAVYEAMLPSDRRDLHRRWGAALADRDTAAGSAAASLLQLAHHWRAARDERALAATIAAGMAAVEGYSFEIASSEFDEALSLWDDDDPRVAMDHVELLERTARACYLASHFRRAADVCEAAIDELGDGDQVRLAELLILLGRTKWVAGDWAGATPLYERALAVAPAEPPIVRVKAMAGLGQVLMLHARMHEARPLCEAAIEGAVAIGDRVMEGHGRNTLGAVLGHLGEVEAARESIAKALEIAMEVRDADDIGRAYVNKADIEAWTGDPQLALETSIEGIGVASEWGVAASYGAYCGFGAVAFGFECGRWQEAREILVHADRISGPTETGYVYRSSYVLEFMANAGDPGFEPLWLETRRLLLDRPPTENHIRVYMGGVAHHAFRGEHARAVELAREAIDLSRDAGTWLGLVELARVASWPVAELGRAASAEGDARALEVARRDMARLLELSSGWTPPVEADSHLRRVIDASAAEITAQQARLESDDGMAMWEAVVERWDELGRPYRGAMARWRLAQAADAAADRERATGALRAAHATASELGAGPLLAQLESLARRLRVRVGGAEAAAPVADRAYGLTPREHEVLAEVAAGRTNKEIAATLFISESTAGVHVSNILGKLGVSTRTEAARVALDEGLTGD